VVSLSELHPDNSKEIPAIIEVNFLDFLILKLYILLNYLVHKAFYLLLFESGNIFS